MAIPENPAAIKKIIASRPLKSIDDLNKADISQKTIETRKSYFKTGADVVPGKPAAGVKTPPAPPQRTTEKNITNNRDTGARQALSLA